MTELKTVNPYDHLLVRTEEAVEVQIKDFKTIQIFDDIKDRIRIFVGNPTPHRFYVGCHIIVPDINLYVYSPITDCMKIGFATTEQNAVLFMLGRIVTNYGEKLPAHIAQSVKQAIFDNRQRSLF